MLTDYHAAAEMFPTSFLAVEERRVVDWASGQTEQVDMGVSYESFSPAVLYAGCVGAGDDYGWDGIGDGLIRFDIMLESVVGGQELHWILCDDAGVCVCVCVNEILGQADF